MIHYFHSTQFLSFNNGFFIQAFPQLVQVPGEILELSTGKDQSFQVLFYTLQS